MKGVLEILFEGVTSMNYQFLIFALTFRYHRDPVDTSKELNNKTTVYLKEEKKKIPRLSRLENLPNISSNSNLRK